MAEAGPHTMTCMEVWGGNAAVDTSVSMTGVDAWLYSRPWKGDAAGGDVHYLSACATGRIVRALVADVAGHGENVSRISERLRDLMRRYVNFVDQRAVVRAMNRQFTGQEFSGRFATAVVATFWTPTDEVDITCAGHPRPLLYDAAAGAWRALQPPARDEDAIEDLPLGIEDAAYGRARLKLGPSDLLVLYTDALVEAGVERGAPLGEQGLIGILQSLDSSRPEGLIPTLMDRIEAQTGGMPGDDATVLVLRPNRAKPRPSVIGGLRTGMRIAREVVRSALNKGGPAPWPQMSRENIVGSFVGRANRRGG